MSLLDPAIIIDIDESNASPEQFHSKFGWSSRGKKAIRLHFQVGSKHYSIAAYAMFGFIAWEIFEGTVTQKEFQHFITVTLAPLITGDSVGLYDNASIHKTVESFGVLDRTFPEGFQSTFFINFQTVYLTLSHILLGIKSIYDTKMTMYILYVQRYQTQ